MNGIKKIASAAIGVVIIVLAVLFNLVGGAPDSTRETASAEQGPAVAAQALDDGATTDLASKRSSSASSGKASSSKGSTSASDSSRSSSKDKSSKDEDRVEVVEDGTYTSKDEVAAYVHEFGHLPSNFISKTKARNAGWESSKGNLDEVCPGKSIGGSVFYNDEGLLPEADGRTWKECDINYTGGYRGGERIVFSNDGLVYYTADHYKTFERLY